VPAGAKNSTVLAPLKMVKKLPLGIGGGKAHHSVIRNSRFGADEQSVLSNNSKIMQNTYRSDQLQNDTFSARFSNKRKKDEAANIAKSLVKKLHEKLNI